jgi:hypothetical protein
MILLLKGSECAVFFPSYNAVLTMSGETVFDFFFSSQGRVYALTILGNFLVRT